VEGLGNTLALWRRQVLQACVTDFHRRARLSMAAEEPPRGTALSRLGAAGSARIATAGWIVRKLDCGAMTGGLQVAAGRAHSQHQKLWSVVTGCMGTG